MRTGASDAAFYFSDLPVGGKTAEWKIRHLVMTTKDALYRFTETKSKKSDPNRLNRIAIGLLTRDLAASCEKGRKQGEAIASGMNLAKTLGNLPGNICTPTYLAQAAQKVAKETGLDVEILDKRAMERLGMGALLDFYCFGFLLAIDRQRQT